jgi:hypothetical protein
VGDSRVSTPRPLICGHRPLPHVLSAPLRSPDRLLIHDALQMRPDWVVDFALTLPGVDTPRIDPISAQRRQNSQCMLRAVTTFVPVFMAMQKL